MEIKKGAVPFKMILFYFLCICALFPFNLWADGFRLRWVEVDVVLDKTGKAQITYAVRWTCKNANLHGFYFKGFVGQPSFDYKNSYALDQEGKSYPLAIKRLSKDTYDIILSQKRSFQNGELTYFFRYANDLEESGNVTQTDSKYGRLAVFNWSPVQWDEALEHETVILHYPIVLESEEVGQDDLRQIKFFTETYLNRRYSLDYFTVKGYEGEHILSIRLHRKDLAPRYHFQVQTYVDASYFNLNTLASGKILKDRELTPAKEPFL